MRSNIVRALTKLSFIDTKSAAEDDDQLIRTSFVTRKRHAALLAVLIDELDDLRAKGHARAVKFLDLLVVGKIILFRVQGAQHHQQAVNVGGLRKYGGFLLSFGCQLGYCGFRKTFLNMTNT
jgi:hypothetical protein